MKNSINCPHCGWEINVEEALSKALSTQLEEHYKSLYNNKLEASNEAIRQQQAILLRDKEEFEAKKKQENEIFKERLAQSIEKERQTITEQIKAQLNEVNEQKIKSLEEENAKRKEENIKLRQQEIILLKKEREIKEREEELQLTLERKLLESQKDIEEKARAKERELTQMKEKELQKQLEDQKKLIEEMKRKSEQGSMQLQGEVQELALESLLRTAFPFDQIQEVPKGRSGADCIQEVFNPQQKSCGSIVYESKRTKNFSIDWIEKLKQDQVSCKAELAVLVTETMPPDMTQFGFRNGIFICRFGEVRSLVFILREMLIRTDSITKAQQNKGSKMELLYAYLTGSEFSQTITRIVEIYSNMGKQLEAEKRSMQKLWSEREKQIWSVQTNLSALFGSIKGIAGNELAISSALELPGPDSD